MCGSAGGPAGELPYRAGRCPDGPERGRPRRVPLPPCPGPDRASNVKAKWYRGGPPVTPDLGIPVCQSCGRLSLATNL